MREMREMREMRSERPVRHIAPRSIAKMWIAAAAFSRNLQQTRGLPRV
jgi:hypothetical protein